MKNRNKKTLYIALGTLVTGVLIGWFFFSNPSSETRVDEQKEHVENMIWTCSMHPQIRRSEPGLCPICGMDLIPLNDKFSDYENPMGIKMSPTAMQLANVQTSVISIQQVVKDVRMNGKVKADERNVSSQTAHIPGRVEKLLVNFTGESVSKGQVIAYVYSPDLVTAQEELFEAYKIRESQPDLFKAAKGKLYNWKLTEKQVNNIIQSGQPQEQLPVLADVSGVVLNKRVNLGDYVQKGQSLFEIADLSKVWVLFDVYESDIQWIKKGDKISFTIQSLPGEAFKGRITFVDPVINPKTRVATARIEMNNPGMKLKPEMFAVGIVKSHVQNEQEALIVPKSAVMWTGERSVVYVKQASVSGVNFMMREVTLGAALGDSYIIKEGLQEGEEIATNGTFSIDAAAQLAGKPSMMNPEGGSMSSGHHHGMNSGRKRSALKISSEARSVFYSVLQSYLQLKEALVDDNLSLAKSNSKALLNLQKGVDMKLFTGKAHDLWMKNSAVVERALETIDKSTNIGQTRRSFRQISQAYIELAQSFGPFEDVLYVQYCPMADKNNGAEWLSTDKQIINPYFGEEMLSCGEIINSID